MSALAIVSETRSHGGVQGVYRHDSHETGTPMTFSVFVPDQASGLKLPVVWYLSGLTCTHANVTEKGEFRRRCAELGLIFIAPDTSPRGERVPDDAEGVYDFGLGAGFYVDATQPPFAANYRMYSYIVSELSGLIGDRFPADIARQAIMGHSMGGHGALVISLRNPGRFRSVSAFAPIVAPSETSWGCKAFKGYLGPDRSAWDEYDACRLLAAGRRVPRVLIDQGDRDEFLATQLRPELIASAARAVGQDLTLRMQSDYDHSYFFISTFMEDHLSWHAGFLSRN